MVRRIDSDALDVLTKAMGLTGPGSQATELLDGTVEQNLNVVPIVRRGRTQAGKEGLYTATIRNSHTGAATVTSPVLPYAVPTVGIIPPYPDPVGPEFDIWLLQASIRQVSGAGTILATLSIRYPGQQGWGLRAGTVFVGVAQAHRLALWDTLISDGTNFAVLAGSGQPSAFPRTRIPRGGATELIFASVSSETAAFDCQMVLGLFPVSLGQDGLV